jgi:hypothetical protein
VRIKLDLRWLQPLHSQMIFLLYQNKIHAYDVFYRKLNETTRNGNTTEMTVKYCLGAC